MIKKPIGKLRNRGRKMSEKYYTYEDLSERWKVAEIRRKGSILY